MRRSARPPGNLKKKAREPNAKINRWHNNYLNIATFDNGTMVEMFKFFNYRQLAINSLVSKRFRDVIQTHRHKLALQYVNIISMDRTVCDSDPFIRMFDKLFLPEAYNEWVNHNNYSIQAPVEKHVGSAQSTQNVSNGYQLLAYANYEGNPIVVAKKMHGFARPPENYSNIATFDNGTMVEMFKFFNYRQLAINSLVSKRFRDVIQTHRHKLALHYVNIISIDRTVCDSDPFIRMFDKLFLPEAYNEWVNRNNYSIQAPVEEHVGSAQSTQNVSNGYQLLAYANYEDSYYRELRSEFTVLFADAELNNETWPLFEHFVRLFTDPFIYIRRIEFVLQEETFNLLAATVDRYNRGRLQCETLEFKYEANAHKFFSWIKHHMHCVIFQIAVSNNSVNCDEQLLDFFATGSHCASIILVTHSRISKDVIIGLVQKFADLKSCDENQIVHTIQGRVTKPTAEALESNYAKCFVKEDKDQNGVMTKTTAHVFKILNA